MNGEPVVYDPATDTLLVELRPWPSDREFGDTHARGQRCDADRFASSEWQKVRGVAEAALRSFVTTAI
jgi:hypothetical protein